MASKRIARWAYATKVALGTATPQIEADDSITIPTLDDWWSSSEGSVARDLLRSADKEIDLGYSEACMGKSSAVVLTKDGFCSHVGVVGMAQAYTKEEPERHGLTCSEAVWRAIDYEFEEIQTEQDVVQFIRDALDDIARDVNQNAFDRLEAQKNSTAEVPMFTTSRITT